MPTEEFTRRDWMLLHDPGEAPLCAGLKFAELDLKYMIKNLSFEPGTILGKQFSGKIYEVTKYKVKRLTIEEIKGKKGNQWKQKLLELKTKADSTEENGSKNYL